MLSPSTPIERVARISSRIVPQLKRMGIRTIRDLLFHFPARYEDFSNIKFIADIQPNETVTVEGVVDKVALHRIPGRRMSYIEARITDESGSIKTVWFNQPFLLTRLKESSRVRMSGKVTARRGGLSFQNPSHERLGSNLASPIHTGRMVPVYPETAGITSRWLRYLIACFLDFRFQIKDPLPQHIRERYDLPDLHAAVRDIHFPKTTEDAKRAKMRFGFEDLFFIHLYALTQRHQLMAYCAPQIPLDVDLMKRFVATLPFLLTNAQRRSMFEIAKDLEKPRPMNRLLEGDVGSGKTVVAASAALLAAKAGWRTAFMAPTEILARQHFDTITRILAPFDINVGLLTGTVKRLPAGTFVAVGTHALIQKHMTVNRLGLVMIDEQHRFGVKQRAALAKNPGDGDIPYATRDMQKVLPHFLSMSATPIPRTLALTVYGDLDISLLDEVPRGRKPVITEVVPPASREQTYQFIRNEISNGRQVFVVCPRIDPHEENSFLNQGRVEKFYSRALQQKLALDEVKSVKEEYKKLSEAVFPDLRVAMLHGKMKPKEKDDVMQKFKNREYDILISTSVIEVGVDVPNATVMMIEGAERFGLATLHQFRGRVGRGSEQSYCFLFATEDGMGMRRLQAVAESENGFELAQKDLELRGPGNLFGTHQSGTSTMLAFALTHPHLVRSVHEAAVSLIKTNSDLAAYPLIKARLRTLSAELHGE